MMRLKWLSLTWLVALAVGLLAAQVSAATPELKTQQDKASYGIGVTIAQDLKGQGIELNVDALVQGMRDVFAGGKLLLIEDEITAALSALQTELIQKQAQAKAKAAEENKKAGDAFLAENKKKEGVVTLPDGLQYKVITAGAGPQPEATDTVEVNYRGTLLDGTEFDSSYRRNQPATFQVSEIIPAWKEALQLMPVGSKWQLFIPSQMAYGARGSGPVIGPNATLIFEVELLAIK